MEILLPNLSEIIIALIGVLAWRRYERINQQKDTE